MPTSKTTKKVDMNEENSHPTCVLYMRTKNIPCLTLLYEENSSLLTVKESNMTIYECVDERQESGAANCEKYVKDT